MITDITGGFPRPWGFPTNLITNLVLDERIVKIKAHMNIDMIALT